MRYDLEISEMVWSYTRLTAFESCPYKWYLTYLYHDDNGNKLDKVSGFFSEYGTFMHKILELYLKGILKPEDMPEYYSAYYVDTVRDAALSRSMDETYFKDGYEYVKNFHFPERETIAVEYRMLFEFGGRKWTGIVDYLNRDKDGSLVITDHKSHRLKPYSGRKKPTATDKELTDYLRQLYIYAEGVYQTYGEYPAYLEFNCFRNRNFIREPFSMDRLNEVKEWATNLMDKIESTEQWEPKPEYFVCHNLCDVCDSCRYKNMTPQQAESSFVPDTEMFIWTPDYKRRKK